MRSWEERREELEHNIRGGVCSLMFALDDAYAHGSAFGGYGRRSSQKEIADLEGYKRGRRDGYKRGWDESEANLRIRIERLFGGEK
jgi:hypothetical protein